MKARLLLIFIFLAQGALAQDFTQSNERTIVKRVMGEGSHVGGGDGLYFRVNKAKELAVLALNEVTSRDLGAVTDDEEVIQFYRLHWVSLYLEAAHMTTRLAAAEKVTALVNGHEVPRKTTTGLTLRAEILVSIEMNVSTSVEELTFNFIHEVGHHITGKPDENEDSTDGNSKGVFLDRLADAVLKAAKKDPEFLKQLQ